MKPRTLLAAAAALGLLATPAAVTPASASTIYSICAPGPSCANFYNGGYLVLDWNGIGVTNDDMRVVSIGGGNVQVEDLLHGGCVGDDQDILASARAGGGLNCPSSGHGAWGTVMTQDYAACSGIGQGWFSLHVRHWNNYDVAIPTGNGQQVYLNVRPGTAGTCMAQFG